MSIRKTVYLSAICLFLLVLLHPFPASSAPLDNWHVRNSVPGGYTLNAVAYGNGMFVAVGSQGTILSSPEGTNWTARSSGTLHNLKGITFGNGMFVAVGGTWDSFGVPRGSVILTSPDGLTWISRISTGTGPDLLSVAYGSSSFAAVGSLGLVMYSPDGITWSSINPIAFFTWQGITWSKGIFVAGGGSGPKMITSPDGLGWTERAIDFNTFDVQGLTHGAGIFVAVGRDFNTYVPMVLISPDGILWSQSTTDASAALFGVTFGNNTFIAVGDHGSMTTSPDGLNWSVRQAGTTESLSSIAYGNSTFVAVGSNGLIIQSDAVIEAVGVPTLSACGMIVFAISCGFAATRSLQKYGSLNPH